MTLAVILLVFAAWLFWVALAGRRSTRPLAPTPPPRPVTPRSRRRAVHHGEPHALYHYLHATRPGRIYIGISSDPGERAARHAVDPRSQRWYPYSTGRMVIVGWYRDYATAHAAEVAAIQTAHAAREPIANTLHVPRRSRRAAP